MTKRKSSVNQIRIVLTGEGGHVALCRLPKDQYEYACETSSSEVEAMIFGQEVEEDHPADLELLPWYDTEGEAAFGPEISEALLSVYDENDEIVEEIAIIDLLQDKNYKFRKNNCISFQDLDTHYGYLAREVQSGKFASILVNNCNKFELENLVIDIKELQQIKIIDAIYYLGSSSKDVRIADLGEYSTQTKFYEYEMLENNAT